MIRRLVASVVLACPPGCELAWSPLMLAVDELYGADRTETL